MRQQLIDLLKLENGAQVEFFGMLSLWQLEDGRWVIYDQRDYKKELEKGEEIIIDDLEQAVDEFLRRREERKLGFDFEYAGKEITVKSRCRGCLLGLATGDAVGATLEFQQPGTFEPLTDMVGGGPFNLLPGQWTDDTSMALCLADSLIAKKGFDATDQMERYVRWFQNGYMSSNGGCFDIGGTTRKSLEKFINTSLPYCGTTEPDTEGNGSLMRLAPIPIFYAFVDVDTLLKYALFSSATTHGALTCIDACRYMALLIDGAIRGYSKPELFAPEFASGIKFCPEIQAIKDGSFRREPPDITGDGYVVKTLEAALWAFNSTDNFKDGCLKVANLGLDADTTAAVYGQLAGAYYGEEGIPKEWLAKLARRKLIEKLADELQNRV